MVIVVAWLAVLGGVGRVFCAVAAVWGLVVAQEGGEALVVAQTLFGALCAAGTLLVGGPFEVVEDLGGSLGAGFLEVGGGDEDGAAEFAYIVPAERHVL